MVVVDDLLKELRVFGLMARSASATSSRWILLTTGAAAKGCNRLQKLSGVSERHASASHHPIDYCATGLTCAEAMPQFLAGRDDERRCFVVVERTTADEIGAVFL